VQLAWQREPVARCAARLKQLGHDDATLTKLEAEADAIIADALQFAESSPTPNAEEAFEDVFA
jgi:TPP-dependent pyruvate/acetoin dehydrogenase alpha subunit